MQHSKARKGMKVYPKFTPKALQRVQIVFYHTARTPPAYAADNLLEEALETLVEHAFNRP